MQEKVDSDVSRGGHGKSQISQKKGKRQVHGSLLNFHFERPAVTSAPVPPSYSRSRHHRTRGSSMTKEKFLQANFKFIVSPFASSLEQGFYEPNAIVPWDVVECVVAPQPVGQSGTCPICLSHIRIPRMTKCGHIFCYTCLLRFMATSRDVHQKCPLCSEYFRKSDLKAVKFTMTTAPAENTKYSMRLLHISRGTLSPYLYNLSEEKAGKSNKGHRDKKNAAQALRPAAQVVGAAVDVSTLLCNVDCSDAPIPAEGTARGRYARIVYATPCIFREMLKDERSDLLAYREECLHPCVTSITGLISSTSISTSSPAISGDVKSSPVQNGASSSKSALATAVTSAKVTPPAPSYAARAAGIGVAATNNITSASTSSQSGGAQQNSQTPASTSTSTFSDDVAAMWEVYGDGDTEYLPAISEALLLLDERTHAFQARCAALGVDWEGAVGDSADLLMDEHAIAQSLAAAATAAMKASRSGKGRARTAKGKQSSSAVAAIDAAAKSTSSMESSAAGAQGDKNDSVVAGADVGAANNDEGNENIDVTATGAATIASTDSVAGGYLSSQEGEGEDGEDFDDYVEAIESFDDEADIDFDAEEQEQEQEINGRSDSDSGEELLAPPSIVDGTEVLTFDYSAHGSAASDSTSITASSAAAGVVPPDSADMGTAAVVDDVLAGPKATMTSTSAAVATAIAATTTTYGGTGDSSSQQQQQQQQLNEFHMYQAIGGEMIFLHPLCAKCLLTAAGDNPEALPLTISAFVLEVETVRMNAATKQRVPYLRHLPEYCDVLLVELDMRQLVPPHILSQFQGDMSKRAKRRKEKAKLAKKEKRNDEDQMLAHAVFVQETKAQLHQRSAKDAALIDELLSGPVVGAASNEGDAQIFAVDGSNDANNAATEGSSVDARVGKGLGESSASKKNGKDGSADSRSFAKIIQMGGPDHFPTLGETTSSTSAAARPDVGIKSLVGTLKNTKKAASASAAPPPLLSMQDPIWSRGVKPAATAIASTTSTAFGNKLTTSSSVGNNSSSSSSGISASTSWGSKTLTATTATATATPLKMKQGVPTSSSPAVWGTPIQSKQPQQNSQLQLQQSSQNQLTVSSSPLTAAGMAAGNQSPPKSSKKGVALFSNSSSRSYR